MAADALEKSVLESKDKEQLVAIASALGLKSVARLKKDDVIKKILEQAAHPCGDKKQKSLKKPHYWNLNFKLNAPRLSGKERRPGGESDKSQVQVRGLKCQCASESFKFQPQR